MNFFKASDNGDFFREIIMKRGEGEATSDESFKISRGGGEGGGRNRGEIKVAFNIDRKPDDKERMRDIKE